MMKFYADSRMRRIYLLLQGALVLFEDTSLELHAVLNKREHEPLIEAFDLIGSALHWMRQEIEKP